MNVKKLIATTLALVLTISMAAGCSSTAPAAPANPASPATPAAPAVTPTEPVNISFYGGWTGGDLDIMQGIVNDFNTIHPEIKVEFTSLQWTEMFTKFLADYQAGSPPDVVALHSFELGQFAKMGVFRPEGIAALNLKAEDYAKVAWDGATYENTLYGVPIDINMHALYYNQDMFTAAGIEKAPTTGAELIETAQKLTIDVNGKNALDPAFDKANIKQYGYGFAQQHHGFYQFHALLNQQGYDPLTADMTTITLDSEKSTKAIQFLQDLLHKYNVTPIGEKSPIDDFKAGNVAMIIDGNWQLSGLAKTDLNWNTAEYPQVFEEKAVWGATELVALTSSKKPDPAKQEAAQTFVKWLGENSAKWAASGQIPANLGAQEASQKLKGIDAYYAELAYVKVLPSHPQATELFSGKAPSPIMNMVQNALLNNKPAADVIPALDKDFNNILKKG